MLEKILKDLGFGEKEIGVYLMVLKHGKITPANLAKLTGINRSTVYSIAKDLVEKGVILEDLAGTHSHLVALPPEDLRNLARKEERELQSRKALIDQAVAELQSFTRDTKYSIPKITFIYEEDLEDFLYQQTPEWNKSVMNSDGVWWGFQDPSFVQAYQKWIDWFWKEAAPKELQLKVLTNQTDFEKKMADRGYDRRIVKFWDKAGDFSATTWVAGDYLLMVVTSKHPHYMVQIHDAALAHNMREMFKGIWK
jgi:sugar-specific transcriptional regulator TrmB